ncbi:sodium-dependent glucose transporter 1A-like [Liolophura sinensis]|uniref:sodium-dependent glucose transporter 1A-like n=1 Tax=Liolophura sinensis TaxID=3198878 RepID=UPI0031589321
MTIEMTTREENGQGASNPDEDGRMENSTRGVNRVSNSSDPVDQQGRHPSPCQSELRRKQIHSAYIFFAFISLGMVVALHGPTFLDLLLILNVHLEQGTLLFTSGSVGYLGGSLIGGIVYDRFNKELTLMISTLMMGVLTVVLPFTRYLPVMAVVNCLRSCFMGGLDAGGNAIMVRIWGKDVGPYMQAVHFAFGLGGIISPFVAAPFLLSRPEDPSNVTDTSSTPHENLTDGFTLSSIPTPYVDNSGDNGFNSSFNLTNSTGFSDAVQQTQVHIPYIIIGLLAVLSSIPFIEMFRSKRAEKRRQSLNQGNEEKEKEIRHIPLTTCLKATFLVLMGFFYITYACVEDTFAGFIMTFVVVHLRWSKTKGTRITSVFWISFSVGRLFAIVISKYLTPWKMLAVDFVLLIVSFLALLLGVESSEAFSWVCTVAVAIAMASIFPSGMTWMDKSIMKISGKVASFLLVCASIGSMANPLLVGYLFENDTPMWFIYLLFAHTLACSAIFAVTTLLIWWIGKRWRSRKSRAENDQRQPAELVQDDDADKSL